MIDYSAARIYQRSESAVFHKTKEQWGGLSNMAAGFDLVVNGESIRTSEALYQTQRFPHRPELQRLIIEQRSPMSAKMVGKPHRHDTRPDWARIRVNTMRWVLRVKLAQNWDNFGRLLQETGDRPIVEQSRRDSFWGALPQIDGTLIGHNVLGRLLMELREHLLTGQIGRMQAFVTTMACDTNLELLGEPIKPIEWHSPSRPETVAEPTVDPVLLQAGLFVLAQDKGKPSEASTALPNRP